MLLILIFKLRCCNIFYARDNFKVNYFTFLVLYQVLLEEKMIENAATLGEVFQRELKGIPKSKITAVRCRGLMAAIDIEDST